MAVYSPTEYCMFLNGCSFIMDHSTVLLPSSIQVFLYFLSVIFPRIIHFSIRCISFNSFYFIPRAFFCCHFALQLDFFKRCSDTPLDFILFTSLFLHPSYYLLYSVFKFLRLAFPSFPWTNQPTKHDVLNTCPDKCVKISSWKNPSASLRTKLWYCFRSLVLYNIHRYLKSAAKSIQ